MRHLLESRHLAEPLAGDAGQAACTQAPQREVWLGESAPEEFLREVVDTLAGLLRDAPEVHEVKTGDASPES